MSTVLCGEAAGLLTAVIIADIYILFVCRPLQFTGSVHAGASSGARFPPFSPFPSHFTFSPFPPLPSLSLLDSQASMKSKSKCTLPSLCD